MYGTNFNPKILTDITKPIYECCTGDIGKISEGTLDRFIIDAAKFNAKMAAKVKSK